MKDGGIRREDRTAVRHRLDGNIKGTDLHCPLDRFILIHTAKGAEDEFFGGAVDHTHIFDGLAGDLSGGFSGHEGCQVVLVADHSGNTHHHPPVQNGAEFGRAVIPDQLLDL